MGRKQISSEFGVAERVVRESKKLKKSRGILLVIEKNKKGNTSLTDDVIELVEHFYTRIATFFRIMPRTKNVVVKRT